MFFNGAICSCSTKLLLAFVICRLSPCVAATSTTTSLTLSPASPISNGTVVTLTAKVSAVLSSPLRGTVLFCNADARFCEDGAVLGQGTVLPDGLATVRTRFSPGPHKIRAIFEGTSTYSGSASAVQSVTSNGLAVTNTAIVVKNDNSGYTFTANVSGFGLDIPTGDVTWTDTSFGNAVLGNASLRTDTPVRSFATSLVKSSYSYAVAVADFNGDGILDLASTGVAYKQGFAVRLGKPDGTFAAVSQVLSVGIGATRMATGDFNGDSHMDVAVSVGNDQSIDIFLGKGDGTFYAKTPFHSQSLGIVTADFNRDGITDLGVDGAVFLGKGDGTFYSKPTPVRGEIVAGDFNGDGIPDIASADGFNSLQVALGKGDGTFSLWSTSPLPDDSAYITEGDFNNDGLLDVATTSLSQRSVTVLLGSGKGTFVESTTVAAPDAEYADTPVIVPADFNGDGNLDLALDNKLLAGRGDGTFSIDSTFDFLPPTTLAFADFNADGALDLVSGTQANQLFVSLGRKNATAQIGPISITASGTHNIAAAYSGNLAYAPSSSPSYPISVAATATPIFVPKPGTLSQATNIKIIDATPGAVIHYTLDGLVPTASSPVYSAPILVNWDASIAAIAITPTGGSSGINSGVYAVDRPLSSPTLSVPSGTYSSPQTLVLTNTSPYCKQSACSIYYTIGGSSPTTTSNLYTHPLKLQSGSTTVVAITVARHYKTSDLVAGYYTIQ